MARASILWLVGQYNSLVPKVAPDVFRKAAKGFTTEESITKLQILNLGAKLCSAEGCLPIVKDIFGYVLELARFDADYDVRDRARFLKALTVIPKDESISDDVKPLELSKNAVDVINCEKSTPALESQYSGRERFILGSMSHALNIAAAGYNPLASWPEVKPDPSTREVPETQESWNRDRVIKSEVKEIKRIPQKKMTKAIDLDNFLDESDSEETDDYEGELML
jgi:AP-3 complex subunit beta